MSSELQVAKDSLVPYITHCCLIYKSAGEHASPAVRQKQQSQTESRTNLGPSKARPSSADPASDGREKSNGADAKRTCYHEMSGEPIASLCEVYARAIGS